MQVIKFNLTYKLYKKIIALLILSFFFASGCKNDKEELLYPGSATPADCDTNPAKFSTDIQPLILSNCAISFCHDDATAQGGLTFKTYQQISAAKDRINTRAVVEKSMPPTGPLLPAEVSKLKCWIDSGAPDN